MPGSTFISDIAKALEGKLYPTVMMWNRLEGSPRTLNFDRAMKAEVRDALWMLTKQWQMGEFQGADAGSPIFAKAYVEKTHLRRYQPGNGAVEELDERVPLEAKVERRPVAFSAARRKLSLDI